MIQIVFKKGLSQNCETVVSPHKLQKQHLSFPNHFDRVLSFGFPFQPYRPDQSQWTRSTNSPIKALFLENITPDQPPTSYNGCLSDIFTFPTCPSTASRSPLSFAQLSHWAPSPQKEHKWQARKTERCESAAWSQESFLLLNLVWTLCHRACLAWFLCLPSYLSVCVRAHAFWRCPRLQEQRLLGDQRRGSTPLRGVRMLFPPNKVMTSCLRFSPPAWIHTR